jgi:predicted enzyme related to lactoylglutathione lyase
MRCEAVQQAARNNPRIFMRRSGRPNYALPMTLAAILLSGLGFSALHAAAFDIPPLNSPASSEHHVGKIVWADLVTPDLAAAERFYGALFGWTFQPVHSGAAQYALASVGGRPVGGLFQKAIATGEHKQPAWLTFVAVGDVDAAKGAALKQGAKIVSDTKNYPARGRQAVLSDPEGAVFAILASSSGDAADFLAAPGEWIWSSLLSQDAATEAAFYQTLFGYEVFDLASDDGSEHVILSSDGFARASVNSFPSDSAHRRAHWLNFIRVESSADIAAKAAALGGRVLVQPHADRHGGQIAVLADPAGAPFGVMEWTAADTKAEPQ